jgi:hypothetical protein
MSDRNVRRAAAPGALQPTDYIALSDRIEALIGEAGGLDYDACVGALVEGMRTHFVALREDRNPVGAALALWDAENLRFVIQEYAAFSNAAIHMFLEARIRNHWPALTQEIVHNMDEEMGALTRGVPHLELMRHGYLSELGVETREVEPTAATRDFIDRTSRLFRDPDNAFLAGALLAFETTAVDEFRIVDRILRGYHALSGGNIPPESLTGAYIAGHVSAERQDGGVDPEMEHYEGMVRAIGVHMRGRNLSVLARGFYAVCLELNRWWELLAQQAPQQAIRKAIHCNRPPAPDPYPALLERFSGPQVLSTREGQQVHAPVA